ncbi:MAG: DUF692 family protein [Alphaproteobacteria bacterium]|nr:DUF692 family protein [Alphaproteobacteria bacterium]
MSEKLAGFGLGMRRPHYRSYIDGTAPVDFIEVISENFMIPGGKPLDTLTKARGNYPLALHGVSMSIGSADGLRDDYLTELRRLVDRMEPAVVSDHLCWTRIDGFNSHDLLPVPYTEEALRHLVDRVTRVQDALGCRLALENPSTYLEFTHSAMPEAEFLARLAQQADCLLLLDVNNVYVSCYNHRLDPAAYLDALPLDRVIQIHLSGHSHKGTHIIDTHDDHVIDDVWTMYAHVVQRMGRVPNTMVEWDDHIPEFPVLLAELEKARATARNAPIQPLPDLDRASAPVAAGSLAGSFIQAPQAAAPSLAVAQGRLHAAIVDGHKVESHAHEWIRAKEKFPPQEQLNVYINAYRYRLFDVLAEDFPVLKHYLGTKAFDKLLWEFIEKVAPDHFNIARYVFKLPPFILTHTSDRVAHQLCQLESAIAEMLIHEETPPLTEQHLAGLTPEALMATVLHPRKAHRLFSFSHAVNDYYQGVMDDASPAAPVARNSYLAVFRHDDVVWRMDMDADEHALLTRLFGGETVGDALQNAPPVAPEKISAWFSRWRNLGMLSADPSFITPTCARSAHDHENVA